MKIEGKRVRISIPRRRGTLILRRWSRCQGTPSPFQLGFHRVMVIGTICGRLQSIPSKSRPAACMKTGPKSPTRLSEPVPIPEGVPELPEISIHSFSAICLTRDSS